MKLITYLENGKERVGALTADGRLTAELVHAGYAKRYHSAEVRCLGRVYRAEFADGRFEILLEK